MPAKQQVARFIRSTFRSVWSLELLLFLRAHKDRYWTPAELVEALRGSDLLVARSLDALFAAGLIDQTKEGAAAYRPARPELDEGVAATAVEYARSPDGVRRTIISGSGGGDLSAFADAFRFKKG